MSATTNAAAFKILKSLQAIQGRENKLAALRALNEVFRMKGVGRRAVKTALDIFERSQPDYCDCGHIPSDAQFCWACDKEIDPSS